MTTTSQYDLYAIGNALVDSEYEVTEAQLLAMKVEKRHMTLIDAARRAELLTQVQGVHSRKSGGGSAGNTVVALAQLGGRGFYSCCVSNDELGAFYADDLRGNGVDSNLTASSLSQTKSASPTGQCMVMVTPDAERSMSTYLGATADLDATALNAKAIAASKIYYMEGYLAAQTDGLASALQGRQIAKAAGVKLATTLSDMSMINFCRPGLEAMLGHGENEGVDYLFANEEEAQTWCGTKDLQVIMGQLSQRARVVCLTRSAKGCIILEGGTQTPVPAATVTAIDTNGAGDMFAGAFLYAVTQGHSHAQAAWLANQAAGQVVSQYGNRVSLEVMGRVKSAFEKHVSG
jgi:sugar/nucleoside kinase (ribokinase family)